MSVSITEHKDGVITRPGGQLDDREMRIFDHKAGVHRKPDWSSLDRSFSRIEKPMRQKAGASREGRDHIIPEHTPISDQGRINSCTATSWCDMLEILDGLAGGDRVEQLSRLFLYWTARYYTGDTDRDGGSYLRAAAHQLRKIGVVEEKYLPYKDTTEAVFESPALDLYTMASNNRLKGFYRVTSVGSTRGLKEIELAIRADHPVVFGAPIDRAFTQARGMDVFAPPGGNETTEWHAMILVGVVYDKGTRHWLLRNSWGKRWGENGHIKVTDDYVRQFRDVWVGTRMDELT
ncbi:C1 family peptidase [Candidatus Thiosymbion oneisti]|uniref:C1 family peptidase n=1 Tax=Candidatus Thiosymbion oneisti TaxID=589554 RepID=UPI000A821105|nr:C1 family peptidase [Candidatus Thiosymbion oneisti]